MPGLVHDLVHRLVELEGAQQDRVLAAGRCRRPRRSRRRTPPGCAVTQSRAGSRERRPVRRGRAAGAGPRSRTSGACPPRRAAARTGPAAGPAATAGSPSKSSSTQPVWVRITWPEVVVAVDPLHRQRLVEPRPARRRPRPAGRRARASSGTAASRRVQPVPHLRRPGRRRAPPGSSCGAERLGQIRGAPRRWPRRAGAPRRRSRRRPRPRWLRRRCGVQVAHAGRGERPAVGGRAQVRGRMAEDGGLAVHRWSRSSRAARATCGEPSRAQRGGHLQVGVGAGRGPAEHLEDGLLAEDQAGVALLGGEHQAVQAGVDQRLPARAGEAQRPDRLAGPRCRAAAAGSARGRAARRRRSAPSG